MDYIVLILLLIIVAILGWLAFSSTKEYAQYKVELNECPTDPTFPKIWESHEPTVAKYAIAKYAMLRLDELEKEVKELKKQLEELEKD